MNKVGVPYDEEQRRKNTENRDEVGNDVSGGIRDINVRYGAKKGGTRAGEGVEYVENRRRVNVCQLLYSVSFLRVMGVQIGLRILLGAECTRVLGTGKF